MTLAVHEMSFEYEKGQPVLQNLNMDFSAHPVIGVVGANGCGKSTLFKLLLGLHTPTAGEVRWRDKAVRYDKRSLIEHRKNVTLMFQEPEQQIFYTDVFSDIAFSLRNLGIDEAEVFQRVEKAISMVDGQQFADKPIQYLSFGQKKRVALAGSLVLGTKYLLLDEPAAGLDPLGTRQMKALIRSISLSGKHVVMSSHDINLIYDVCDYVYVMNDGGIESQGVPEQVFLDKALIEKVGLEQPWLVRIHQELGMPLFRSEHDLSEASPLKNVEKECL
ncbi:energy-coupling factor ABC transporter ATP-binding protein [Vibrio albus]|uniref:ABC transporter ATP-binding protein n=1 Tax=Vibrio albus TaxID=2200953 RepID=A0A2U3B615_9VIBR|nr:ATP-binding cassette domain-containing protein [Vibrio albus]PWI32241.1 energy-coupling factor ABC transporter ATP-binding protein [Vibrio albus]